MKLKSEIKVRNFDKMKSSRLKYLYMKIRLTPINLKNEPI